MPGLDDLVGSYGDTAGVDTLARPTAADKSAPAPRGPTITDLIPTKQDVEGYAGIVRDETHEAQVARQSVIHQSEQFAHRLEQQYNATGVDPSKFQKWDAQQEWDKRQTQPLEAFGSLGSVFGMIASAFTHAPMENALNASAAAMNAIHAGDRDSYGRAHEAWKQNIDLAMKRQEMERQHYLDAFKLFDVNMQIGQAKIQEVAARYKDEKMLYLADRGMIPEMFQLVNDRTNMVAQATKAANELDTDRLQRDLFEKQRPALEQIQDPVERGKAFLEAWNNNKFLGAKPNDPQAVAMGQFIAEKIRNDKRLPTSDEMIQFERKFAEAKYAGHGASGQKLSPEQIDIYNGFVKENVAKGMDLTEAQQDALRRVPPIPRAPAGVGGAGGGLITEDRQRKASVDDIMKEKETSGELKGKSKQEIAEIRADVSRELKERGTPLGTNRADDLRRSIGQLDRASRKIDDIEKMMKQHGMITGLGGQIRRPGETIVDILGGDATAAKEFQAQLTELQQWVSQLIDNKVTSGRPLSLAETRVNTIVPGLKLGDTVQFVTKQLRSVQKDLQDMQRENTARLNKSPDMPGASGAPAATPAQEPAWKRLGIPVQ